MGQKLLKNKQKDKQLKKWPWPKLRAETKRGIASLSRGDASAYVISKLPRDDNQIVESAKVEWAESRKLLIDRPLLDEDTRLEAQAYELYESTFFDEVKRLAKE